MTSPEEISISKYFIRAVKVDSLMVGAAFAFIALAGKMDKKPTHVEQIGPRQNTADFQSMVLRNAEGITSTPNTNSTTRQR